MISEVFSQFFKESFYGIEFRGGSRQLFKVKTIISAQFFQVCTGTIGNQQYLSSLFIMLPIRRIVWIQLIQVAGEVLSKHAEAVFGHIRQYQTEQGTSVGIKGCIQIAVLIA